eukprot:10794835-Alexandrium_andersonii.AAC.1
MATRPHRAAPPPRGPGQLSAREGGRRLGGREGAPRLPHQGRLGAARPPRELRQAAESLRLASASERVGEFEREVQHLAHSPGEECVHRGQVNEKECPCHQDVVAAKRGRSSRVGPKGLEEPD